MTCRSSSFVDNITWKYHLEKLWIKFHRYAVNEKQVIIEIIYLSVLAIFVIMSRMLETVSILIVLVSPSDICIRKIEAKYKSDFYQETFEEFFSLKTYASIVMSD